MREINKLEKGWKFSRCTLNEEEIPQVENWQEVTLPHVWNKENPKEEGPVLYRYYIEIDELSEDTLYYLDFGAVAGACTVWLNGTKIGTHRGGYARFRFALSTAIKKGENELLVLADNTRYDDIAPLGGDFSNYGGIYRMVELIRTNTTHFDLLYYGTSGLFLTPHTNGTVQVESRLVGMQSSMQIEYTILDGESIVAQTHCSVDDTKVSMKVEQPHFWNGKVDPHLYTCQARILDNGKCLDEVSLPFGFRSMELSSEHGFSLNGEQMVLCGVAKHQDYEGVACATTKEQMDEDMALIKEIGANAVRLSHYQHPDYFYDLCDKEGMIVWAEIPMLGMPDGNDGVVENAKQQLTELILQCAHHPSIICWGIQNEIAMMGESLEMYRKTEELNALVKELDSTRLTASANLYCVKNKSQLNYITDMLGYNIYFGWYYDEMEDYNPFFDKFHADNPQIPLGVSEYGVDCSVTLHATEPKRKDYSEEFQCLYHETVYPMIRNRSWLWGSFVWNMFDFGSSIRDEGGVKGKNCKGLVSFDRKIKKDSFYYYKAWWSKEAFVHVAGRRFVNRCGETTTIKVYSNQPEVTLEVNGKTFGSLVGERVFTFEQVPMNLGENSIRVFAGVLQDEITIIGVNQPDESYIYHDPNPEFNVKNWFTMGQSKEELFPENYFSIMDEMGTLSANQEAWALLEQEVPQVTENPRAKTMPSITLLRVINRMSGLFEEEFIKQLNLKLNQISKK